MPRAAAIFASVTIFSGSQSATELHALCITICQGRSMLLGISLYAQELGGRSAESPPKSPLPKPAKPEKVQGPTTRPQGHLALYAARRHA